MTNTEIAKLVADCKAQSHIQDWHARHLITAIEVLLARQAEVVVLAHPPRWADLVELGGKLEVATDRLDKIRVILNPGFGAEDAHHGLTGE
jgi:hypothetical protein